MKIEDIVGKNLLTVTIAEDDSYRFQFEGDELLFINTPLLTDDSGDEIQPGDVDGKGVKSVDYEDEELAITFLDDTTIYAATTEVKDRFGLDVQLEDPEAGADASDIDENDQDEPSTLED